MASYLRPRRGKKATATSQLTASAPLKRGEVFFEVPDTGVGTGAGKIKMGDGTTAYASLPYFLEQPTVDYTNAVVAWTNTTAADSDPYSTNATYAGNIIPSASLKTIFTNLKKLLLNYNSQLTTLNNDLVSFQNGVDTIVDGCTTYGSTPTASTPSKIVEAIKSIYNNRYNAGVTATKKGTAVASDVLSGKTFTNASSVNISGTMTNNGAISKTITPSASTQSYTIPKGYHNGSGKVTVNAAVPSSNVSVAHLIIGRYANGSSVSTHATTNDTELFTAKGEGSASTGYVKVNKSCHAKLFVIATQRGSTASTTVKLNGTIIVSGSAYSNGYQKDVNLVAGDKLTVTLEKPDTTYAAFGFYLIVAK